MLASPKPKPHPLQEVAGAVAQGRFDDAMLDLNRYLKINGPDPDAYNLKAAVLGRVGRVRLAEKVMRRALDLRPNNVRYLVNLAFLMAQRTAWKDCLAICEQALSFNPSYAPGHSQRGTALMHLGRTKEARDAYLEAIRLDPALLDGWNNLGILYKSEGALDDAHDAFQHALTLDPDYAPALNNLGTIYLHRGQAENALNVLQHAVAQNPNMIDAWDNLGQTHQLMGNISAASQCYRKGLEKRPDDILGKLRTINLCPVIPKSLSGIGIWRRRFMNQLTALPVIDLADHVQGLEARNAQIPFRIVYQGVNNLELRQSFSRLFKNSYQAYTPQRNTGPARIAFIVTSGHEGIFLTCNRGIIRHWGSTDARLTIVCSRASLRKMQAALPYDHLEWLPLPSTFLGALHTLRDQHFDLAYFWEIGTDALNYFLPFFRVANLQCTSWGTSESTGLPNVDVYLSCRSWEAEPRPELYSERLVLLDRIPACFDHPGKPGKLDPASLGIDTQVPFLLCPQNPFKLHPDFDQILFKAHLKDVKFQIVLVEGSQPAWTKLLYNRLLKVGQGIRRRLKFVPRLDFADYLSLLTQADVVLDSPHFTGGATSYQALSLGVPIVTMPGEQIRSRFTTGYYRQMGVDDCIVHSRDAYIELVLELLQDRERHAAIRKKLSGETDKILHDVGAAHDFEKALNQLALARREEL